ncbi:MAG TPA: hypothetical protein VLA68_02985 [Nitrososphaera sp.]|nr:hypothetical protein [Nitrososphaera sp.]
MADLVLQKYDSFNAVYDMLLTLNEGVMSEPVLASALNLPPDIAQELVSFVLAEGFVRTDLSENSLRISLLGCDFLKEFEGMKKFLS